MGFGLRCATCLGPPGFPSSWPKSAADRKRLSSWKARNGEFVVRCMEKNHGHRHAERTFATGRVFSFAQWPRYHMSDLDHIGGVPVVMRELLDAGLLHGDCMTVTGRTVAENLAGTPSVLWLEIRTSCRQLVGLNVLRLQPWDVKMSCIPCPSPWCWTELQKWETHISFLIFFQAPAGNHILVDVLE